MRVFIASPHLLPVVTLARAVQVSETGVPVIIEESDLPEAVSVTDVLQNADQPTLLLSARSHKLIGDLALFGVHVWTKEECAFAKQRRVQTYSMLEISREGLQEMTDSVMSYVRQWQSFRLVVHMDALDLAFGGKYPGGFSSRELLYIVQRLRLIKTLASVEIVIEEMHDAVARVAAQLLAELA